MIPTDDGDGRTKPCPVPLCQKGKVPRTEAEHDYGIPVGGGKRCPLGCDEGRVPADFVDREHGEQEPGPIVDTDGVRYGPIDVAGKQDIIGLLSREVTAQ